MASQRIGGFNPTPPYELRTRFLFNPELNSRWFVIPGLTVVVMAILSILLTALTVAREWENGSMELLLSTPVQPLEIIVGKACSLRHARDHRRGLRVCHCPDCIRRPFCGKPLGLRPGLPAFPDNLSCPGAAHIRGNTQADDCDAVLHDDWLSAVEHAFRLYLPHRRACPPSSGTSR